MAVTKVELFQGACFHLGEEFVGVDDSPAMAGGLAAKLRAALPRAAEFVLSLNAWNFARRMEALELDADLGEDTNPPLVGWLYAYHKKAWLRLNWLSPTGLWIDRIASGWDDRDGHIVSNQGALYADFVARAFAEDAYIGLWARPFAEAVSSVMADYAAKPVTQSRSTQADISARSQALIDTAATWDAQQSPAPPRRRGRWARSRSRDLTTGLNRYGEL